MTDERLKVSLNKLSRFILKLGLSLLLGIGLFLTVLQNREVIKEKGAVVSSFLFSIDDYLSKPFLPLQNLIDNAEHLFATYDENEVLKKENVVLRLENSRLSLLEEENQALREMLQLKKEDVLTTVIPARVKTRSPVKWYETFRINRGKNNGIVKGMLALSEGALVGVVTDSYRESSLVTLLTTTKQFSPIPVKVLIEDGAVFGILSSYDEEKDVFVMTQLSSSSPIPEKSSVLTSGLDGKSVSDLPVGQVVGIEENQDNLLRQVYIKSLVDFSDIAEVMVVGE